MDWKWIGMSGSLLGPRGHADPSRLPLLPPNISRITRNGQFARNRPLISAPIGLDGNALEAT